MTQGNSGTEDGHRETEPVEHAIERIERAEADLGEGKVARAEGELKEAVEELEHLEHHRHYDLIVNRKPYTWPREKINGREIKELASSPADWIVNERVDGPGEDPEIADDQEVDLARREPPHGIKRFITRKPKTSPGA